MVSIDRLISELRLCLFRDFTTSTLLFNFAGNVGISIHSHFPLREIGLVPIPNLLRVGNDTLGVKVFGRILILDGSQSIQDGRDRHVLIALLNSRCPVYLLQPRDMVASRRGKFQWQWKIKFV